MTSLSEAIRIPAAELALPRTALVLGGARSGKSRFAEQMIEDALGDRYSGATYVATAEPRDAEMAERIARHRARRSGRWQTVEEYMAVPAAIRQHANPHKPVLVDCLTLWLSNLLLAEQDTALETTRLVTELTRATGPVVVVSNEVGLGIVPENPLARRFRDAAGRLNQAVAAVCDHVVLVAAGLPLVMKGERQA